MCIRDSLKSGFAYGANLIGCIVDRLVTVLVTECTCDVCAYPDGTPKLILSLGFTV